MAADLFVRILFQSNEFDRSINNSRTKAKQFQSDLEKSSGGFQRFGSMATSAAGMIGKFAGGLGIAMGAFEVFDKAINSNAKLQNDWQTIMGTAGEVTSQFFRSLTSGDWSIFGDGIDNAISKAKEYTETIRDMQRMFEAMQSRYDIIEADKTRLESIIEDESLSLKQRTEAYNQMDSLMTQSIEKFLQKLTTAKNELNSSISDKIGSNRYLNADNVNKLQNLILDLRDPTSDLVKDLEEYKKAKDAATVKANWNVFKESGDEAYKRMQESARKFYSTYSKSEREKNDELLRLQNSLNDTMYQEWKEMIDNISQYAERVATWQKDLSGARDEITSAQEELDKAASEAINKASKDKENIIPEGSILELQKKISDLTTSFQKAADDGTRAGLQKAISEAQTQLEMMKLRANNTTLSVPGIGKTTGRNPTEDIKSGYISVKPIEAETIQANYDYADSLSAIGSMMSSVSNITNEGAAGWLRYASSLVGSISSAIPALRQLYTANQAVAIAEGTKSAASTPVIGWITAIGAIGSMIAAFATIPKFANGGVIPGNMFSGDRVPVLANSGEMILNRTQQGYLFNMLQSGGYRKNDEIPTVRFEIGYDKLIGVLNNGNRKARRTT